MRQFVRPEQMPKINEKIDAAEATLDLVRRIGIWYLDPAVGDEGAELYRLCDKFQSDCQAAINALREVKFAISDAWHENYPAATTPSKSRPPTTDDLMV